MSPKKVVPVHLVAVVIRQAARSKRQPACSEEPARQRMASSLKHVFRLDHEIKNKVEASGCLGPSACGC
eukprot:822362-Alexandrium_andersonii.AAC.1